MITLDDRRVSRILSPQSRRFRLHTEHPTPRAARPIPIAAGFLFPPSRRSEALERAVPPNLGPPALSSRAAPFRHGRLTETRDTAYDAPMLIIPIAPAATNA